MNRIKKRSVGTYTLTATAYDEDGDALVITAPVIVTIKNGSGATIVTDTPTITATGTLTYEANAALFTTLDIYSINWTGTVAGNPQAWQTEVEIVGGYLFEISELRAQDRTFVDPNKYPADTMREIRNWVEDVIEGPRAANVAFVPRGRRVTLDGTGRAALLVPDLEVRSIYSITVDGTAWTAPQIQTVICDDGVLWLEPDSPSSIWPEGHRNVTVHYEHGHDYPPGAITRAGLMLAKEYLVKSDVPGRATATSIGDQLFRLTIAGRDGVTGLPDVDAAIAQFGRKQFSIG